MATANGTVDGVVISKKSNKLPYIEITDVTPAIAQEWLSKSFDRNRKVRWPKVKQYCAAILNDDWWLSDQCISFDVDGELVNGRHRLHACLLSGKTIKCPVMFNLPKESVLILDGAVKRSTDDNFKMAGKEYVRGCGATVRRILTGTRTDCRPWNDSEVDEFMQSHDDAVAFAHHVLPKGRVAAASVRAPVVRALIKRHPKGRLEQFGFVLSTGFMVPGDEAAVLVRNYLLETETGGSGRRAKIYSVVEVGLQAFLNKEHPKKLEPVAEELFPISTDKAWGYEIPEEVQAT